MSASRRTLIIVASSRDRLDQECQLVPAYDADPMAGGDASLAARAPVLAANAHHALRPAVGDGAPAAADQCFRPHFRLPAERPAPRAERLDELEDRGEDHDRNAPTVGHHED